MGTRVLGYLGTLLMLRFNSLIRWLIQPPPARLGIEFRPDEVIIVRFSEKRRQPEMDLCLRTPIPSGIVGFSMTETNIQEAEGLSAFLRKLLDQAGIRDRRIALTLPDILARVSVVDIADAPRRRKDLEEELRFRTKKSLPFGTEQVRLAFKPVPGSSSLYFTGVMHDEVVAQYENLLGDLGFHVGVVETSSLSLLNLWQRVADRQVPKKSDYFLLNLEENYFSLILVRDGAPILLRTLGDRSPAPGGESNGPRYQIDDVVREIVPTLIFYRERLDGTVPARVYYRSLRPDLNDLKQVLESQFETPVEVVDLHQAVIVEENLQIDAPLASTVSAAAGAALGEAV